MPRAAKKTEIPDPNLVYRAWQAGSCDIDGAQYSVVSGERRRGDDPFVVAHPWLFVEDGVPAAEMPNAFGQLVARQEAARPPAEFEVTLAGALPTPLEIEDVIQLTRAVTVRAGYVDEQRVATYEQGTVFPTSSEIASLLPADAYEHTEIQFTRAKGRR